MGSYDYVFELLATDESVSVGVVQVEDPAQFIRQRAARQGRNGQHHLLPYQKDTPHHPAGNDTLLHHQTMRATMNWSIYWICWSVAFIGGMICMIHIDRRIRVQSRVQHELDNERLINGSKRSSNRWYYLSRETEQEFIFPLLFQALSNFLLHTVGEDQWKYSLQQFPDQRLPPAVDLLST